MEAMETELSETGGSLPRPLPFVWGLCKGFSLKFEGKEDVERERNAFKCRECETNVCGEQQIVEPEPWAMQGLSKEYVGTKDLEAIKFHVSISMKILCQNESA